MNREAVSKVLQSGRKESGSIPTDPEERKVEILTVLESLSLVEDRSGKQGRLLRRHLRSLGFRLSNPEHVQEARSWIDNLA